MPDYDVIIIGAGIAGSVLARLLAEGGAKTLLLEKDEFSGQTSACGGLFDRPYFDRYADNHDLIEQHISSNVFIMPWGEVRFDCNQVTVKRRRFDRYLAEQAQQTGAFLLNKTKALDWRVTAPGQVEVEYKSAAQDSPQKASGRCIAFADGPKSLARRNPRFYNEKYRKYWAYAYAYETSEIPFNPQEIRIYLDGRLFPWGYGWIFPNRNECNIGVGTIQSEMDKGIAVKEKLIEFITEYPASAPLLAHQKITDKKGGFIPMWLQDHFSDDSQLILGDAAGMVSPLFGAGIDYAIESAEAAAGVLLEALKLNRWEAGFLNQYDLALENRFLKDLQKQIKLAGIIIRSLNWHKSLPIKILAIFAFGLKYSRWNKIKILFYPLLGKPMVKENKEVMAHK